jgi:hypothetical protein
VVEVEEVSTRVSATEIPRRVAACHHKRMQGVNSRIRQAATATRMHPPSCRLHVGRQAAVGNRV